MELQIINDYGGFNGTDRTVMLGRGLNNEILELNFQCDEVGVDDTERKISVNLAELRRTLAVVRDLETYGSVRILDDSYDSYVSSSKLNLRYADSDGNFILEINHGFEFHFDAYRLLSILEALDY
ncbi:hypothetical protein [Bacillus toyonensis]|uniref:hypothetical protein n=1 Tax=Bacillus toyonensis TaxID=155322 RepID=UPI002E21169B|nr:hypothetical protein [Bacillus toyonensis]